MIRGLHLGGGAIRALIIAGAIVLIVCGIALSAPVGPHRRAAAAGHLTTRDAVYLVQAPSNASLPLIAGSAIVGDTIASSTGVWAGAVPISYGYQWQTCNPVCSNVPGAVTYSYELAPSDLGAVVRIGVTATNSNGHLVAFSAETSTILPSPQQVRSALGGLLSLSGSGAKIPKLLHNGGYSASFTAPSAGRLVVDWYFVPKGAHIAKAGKAKPVLVASLNKGLGHAGKTPIRIKLSRHGHKLLQGRKREGLTIQASFKPNGESAATRSRRITVTK
jgi:hypothetical protein